MSYSKHNTEFIVKFDSTEWNLIEGSHSYSQSAGQVGTEVTFDVSYEPTSLGTKSTIMTILSPVMTIRSLLSENALRGGDVHRGNRVEKLKKNKEHSGNNISKKNELMDWKLKMSHRRAAEYFLPGLFIRVNLWWSTLEILSLLKKQKSERKNIQRIPINMEVTCIILYTRVLNGASTLPLSQGNSDGS